MIYKGILLDSIKILKNNLKLFIPDIILLASTLIISTILLLFTGLLPKVLVNPSMLYDINVAKDVLVTFFSSFGNIIRTIVSLIALIITLFFIGTGLMAVKYSMIKDVLLKKRISYKKSIETAKRFFWRIILLKIYLFLIIALPIFLVFLLISFLFIISKPLAITIGSILGFISLIYLILATLAFLFRYPILFLNNLSSIQTLKTSIKFFKKQLKYVIICEILIIIITTLFAILVNTPLNLLQSLLTDSILIFLFFVILRRTLQIIPRLWTEVFVFVAYNKRRLKSK
jgi:hypothetical protein